MRKTTRKTRIITPSALHNLTSLWPFSMGVLYIIRPIEPKASNEHRFILVAIDYFTKWVEANITKSVVVKFIKRDIICRYGLLAHIITNNGTNLNNKMMTKLCEQFKIKHYHSTPYCPQMNEAVEATNKKIKKINPKDQPLSLQDGGVNTVQHEGNRYQSPIEGIRPEAGLDLKTNAPLCRDQEGEHDNPSKSGNPIVAPQ
ncbi:Pol polyprotein, partial [Mucuna pruriens]